MRAIGGFLELELNQGAMHDDVALAFNSGANALHFLLENSTYKTVFVPFFTCVAVLNVVEALKLNVRFYNIDQTFRPLVDFQKFNEQTVLIYNNYFGVNDIQVNEISQKTPHLIIDAAQAFYFKPEVGRFCFNSTRKFFGVPDGGFLYGFNPDMVEAYNQLKETPYSFEHLINRLENGAEKSYDSYIKSEEVLASSKVGKISKLTKALLGNVDFENVKQKRVTNFKKLHDFLDANNDLELNIISKNTIPLCYPYLAKNGNQLKQYLNSKLIFIPTYWPNFGKWIRDETVFENHLFENLVCLPIDQRYGIDEMNYIIETLKTFEHA